MNNRDSVKFGLGIKLGLLLSVFGVVAAGFTGSIVTGNSPCRSAAMDASGAKSQLPSLVAAVTIALVLLYGGYCAYGVALGKKFWGDPEVWEIVDGTLYLNLDKSIQQEWDKDKAGYITKAGSNWPAIKDKSPGEL